MNGPGIGKGKIPHTLDIYKVSTEWPFLLHC